jgi:uncharacterized membrane protein
LIPLGHIAGIPVEETALSFGPVLLAAGGIAALKLRAILARIRATVASRAGSRRPVAR